MRDTDSFLLENSEKAKQKLREEKWQRLRDAAIKNKDDSSPLPASLLLSVAPEGTYNPQRELEREQELLGGGGEEEEDSSFDVDEELGGISPSESSYQQGQHQLESPTIESDDGYGDLVSLTSFDSNLFENFD